MAFQQVLKLTKTSQKSFGIVRYSMHDHVDYMEEFRIDYLWLGRLGLFPIMHRFLQVAYQLALKLTTISQKSFGIIQYSRRDHASYKEEFLIDYP
jgi:hypothetical protein